MKPTVLICRAVLLVVALSSSWSTYGASVACTMSLDQQLASLEQVLAKVDAAIPTVPNDSSAYFYKEYSASLASQASGRLAMVEKLPYFDEWRVREAMSSFKGSISHIRDSADISYSHPFKSAAKNRIYWASNAMSAAAIGAPTFISYANTQRHAASPTLTLEMTYTLADLGRTLSYYFDQITQCELDRMGDIPTDNRLKSYPVH